jgi:hypothetical protein
MPKRNELHEDALAVAGELNSQRLEAAKSKVVPFGQEQLAPAEAMKRLGAMTEDGRGRFLAENGMRKVMEILRNA